MCIWLIGYRQGRLWCSSAEASIDTSSVTKIDIQSTCWSIGYPVSQFYSHQIINNSCDWSCRHLGSVLFDQTLTETVITLNSHWLSQPVIWKPVSLLAAGQVSLIVGRAMARAVSRRPFTAGPRVDAGLVHVGYVVDNVTLGQVFPLVLRVSSVSFIPQVFHCT